MKPSELEIDLGSTTMVCTRREIGDTLSALLGEMRAVLPKLREDERELLRRIMSADSGTLTVQDVFPDFGRETEAHRTLRRLRAAQFVRPAVTGRWDPDERIEVKPFARLMWDHVGEEAIFAPATAHAEVPSPAEGVAAAEATEQVELGGAGEVNDAVIELDGAEGDAVIDLMGVDEEEVAPKQKAKAKSNGKPKGKSKASWDEDAVMAFLNDGEEDQVIG
jgi:hypothetical protein